MSKADEARAYSDFKLKAMRFDGSRTSAEGGLPAVRGRDGAQPRRGAADGGDGCGVRQVPLQAALLHVQLLQPPQQLVAALLQLRVWG